MTDNAPISRKRENRWAWVWFAYTGFLFIDPILETSRYLWLATLAVFFVFVGIMWGYIHAVDEGHPARFWMIAATFGLGLIAFPLESGRIHLLCLLCSVPAFHLCLFAPGLLHLLCRSFSRCSRRRYLPWCTGLLPHQLDANGSSPSFL